LGRLTSKNRPQPAFAASSLGLKRVGSATGIKRLNAITKAYLSFADKHPARCALMFGAQIEQARDLALALAGDNAFAVLVDTLSDPGLGVWADQIEATAIQVWAHCHGLASLKAGLALKFSGREIGKLTWSGWTRLWRAARPQDTVLCSARWVGRKLRARPSCSDTGEQQFVACGVRLVAS
jgi:hypothetical protein